MRGWAIGFLVLVLGAGVWLLGPWADAPPEIGEAGSSLGDEQTRTVDEEPPDELRSRSPTGIAPRQNTPPVERFTVPVALLAFVVTELDGGGKPVDGFGFRLNDANGRLLQKADDVKSGRQLKLGIGSYVIHVSIAGRIAPGPSEFTITKASEPFSLRFPFREAEATLMLEVLDQTTKARIQDYRLTIETHVDDGSPPKTRFVPKAETNPIAIPGARGERLVVTIEAKDFAPGKPLTIEFDGTLARIDRQVFLAPSMKFAGVEFHVTDDAGTTIQNVIVLAELRQQDRSFKKLWRRRKGDSKGIYKLPDLAPGDYRFGVESVSAEGEPTLHVAYSHECQVTGNEHIREPIVLKIGGAIELHLTDSLGRTIGKDVSIELTHPDGKVHVSLWRPVVDGKPDMKAKLTADHLATDGHARLDQAVARGLYKVKLRWANGPDVVAHVMVQAGDVHALNQALTKE